MCMQGDCNWQVGHNSIPACWLGLLGLWDVLRCACMQGDCNWQVGHNIPACWLGLLGLRDVLRTGMKADARLPRFLPLHTSTTSSTHCLWTPISQPATHTHISQPATHTHISQPATHTHISQPATQSHSLQHTHTHISQPATHTHLTACNTHTHSCGPPSHSLQPHPKHVISGLSPSPCPPHTACEPTSHSL